MHSLTLTGQPHNAAAEATAATLAGMADMPMPDASHGAESGAPPGSHGPPNAHGHHPCIATLNAVPALPAAAAGAPLELHAECRPKGATFLSTTARRAPPDLNALGISRT